jgi:RNA polymerase sigma-70 factor (ECF subfamily)
MILLKPEAALPRSNAMMGTTAAPPAAQVAGEADERALVERARAGDEDAYRVLVERHQDRAYGLALRIVRSAADAEEVAQDAFVRAWLALSRFRGEAKFSTWLYRIVARRAFDRAAVLRLRRGRESGLEAAEAIGRGDSGAEAASRAAVARRMERLIETLSSAQRAAVTLFYYEGKSVEQVAASLAMPENTVKTHLSRARAALRAAWLRESGGGA